jgi:hypothetical protein
MSYSDTTSPTTGIDASAVEGANRGQRPDLLANTSAIYRTPNGKLWVVQDNQLVRQRPKFPFGRSLVGMAKWFGAAQSGVTINQTASLESAARTVGLKMTAEAAYDAVRLVWVNRAGNAVNNCSALVAATETAATTTNTLASVPHIGGVARAALAGATDINGWRPVTWNGASTVSLPAGTTEPQYAISDWIPLSSAPRTDGGTLPLLMLRAQHDGSVDGAHALMAAMYTVLNRGPSAANRSRLVQATSITTGVSVPANTGPVTNNTFEVFPIFRYRTPALTVMVAGDSTEQNDFILPDLLTM